MDAEEFFNQFIDKLEGLTAGSRHPNVVKNYFGGRLVTELIGKNTCKHRSEREEPLIHIQLDVKNQKNILEGLEQFVEGELLEKDNAYQCDHCDEKVTALRRVCFKRLPNVMVIVLRRFEFDYDTMTRNKLNDQCEFPLELDMKPYTQEGIETLATQATEAEGETPVKPQIDV
jgi:ubiquitin C-terminal hydrolase